MEYGAVAEWVPMALAIGVMIGLAWLGLGIVFRMGRNLPQRTQRSQREAGNRHDQEVEIAVIEKPSEGELQKMREESSRWRAERFAQEQREADVDAWIRRLGG